MKNLITGRFMRPFTFWINEAGRELKAREMDDNYIKNLCFFIAQGRGYWFFIHNRRRIRRIYLEALKRKVRPDEEIQNLYRLALCVHGYARFDQGSKSCPPQG